MNIRQRRLKTIISILNTHVISNQDELQKALISEGVIITQATLSRDLKYLNVIKTALSDGTYKYIVSQSSIDIVRKKEKKTQEANNNIITEIGFSGQFAVVKTRPGYANAVAYDIDTRGTEFIFGTIAGDDTILVIPREDCDKETIKDFLENLK